MGIALLGSSLGLKLRLSASRLAYFPIYMRSNHIPRLLVYSDIIFDFLILPYILLNSKLSICIPYPVFTITNP